MSKRCPECRYRMEHDGVVDNDDVYYCDVCGIYQSYPLEEEALLAAEGKNCGCGKDPCVTYGAEEKKLKMVSPRCLSCGNDRANIDHKGDKFCYDCYHYAETFNADFRTMKREGVRLEVFDEGGGNRGYVAYIEGATYPFLIWFKKGRPDLSYHNKYYISWHFDDGSDEPSRANLKIESFDSINEAVKWLKNNHTRIMEQPDELYGAETFNADGIREGKSGSILNFEFDEEDISWEDEVLPLITEYTDDWNAQGIGFGEVSVSVGSPRKVMLEKLKADLDNELGGYIYYGAETFNSYKVAPELSSYTVDELVASKAGPQGSASYDEMVYDPIAQDRLSAETFEAEGKVGKNKWLQAIYDAIYDENDHSYKIMYQQQGQYGYPISTSASLIELSMTQKALADGKKPPTKRQVKNGMLKSINEVSGKKLNPKGGAKNYGVTTKASYEYNGKRFFADYTVQKPLRGAKEPYTLTIHGEEYFENPMLFGSKSKDNDLRSYEAETFNAEEFRAEDAEYQELIELSNEAKENYMELVDESDIEEFCEEYDLDYNDSNDRERAVSKYLEQIPFEPHIIEALDQDEQERYYQLKAIVYGAETFNAEEKEHRVFYSVVDTDTGEEIDDGQMVVEASSMKEALEKAQTMLEEGAYVGEEYEVYPNGMRVSAETFEAEGNTISIPHTLLLLGGILGGLGFGIFLTKKLEGLNPETSDEGGA